MTATGHAMVGTIIAGTISNPLLSIPIALVSHVICDIIPHWDAGTHMNKKKSPQLFWESVLDVTVSYIASFLLLTFLFPETSLLYGFFIAFMAQLLDWITAPYYILKWKFPPFSWFYTFSGITNTRLDKPWGIVTQVVFVTLLMIVAKV